MLFLRSGALLTALSLLTSSAVGEVFEKLRAVPEGWRFSHTPSGNEHIRLQIALHQHNAADFEKAVYEMSDPDHPSYGQHFNSHDEMKRMLMPSDSAVSSVSEWLESAGITDFNQDAEWINFQTTVEKANALLHANFKWYYSQVKHVQRLRTLEYSIPASVAPSVDMIQPTTRFGQIHANRATLRSKPKHVDENILKDAVALLSPEQCDSVITPHCLKSLYNVGDYTADPKSGSTIGFSSYLEEYARYADLELFEENLAPWAKGHNFSVVSYNGGKNDQDAAGDSGEANLDAQYIVGVSAPVPVTEFSTGGRGPVVPDVDQPDPNAGSNEPYLEFLNGILKRNQDDLPLVLSTSYGEDEMTIPEKYARKVCQLYSQLGSRGVSVIFSSGDSGVGSACLTNDGTNRSHFPPQFPAACPWVTSVGATHKTNPEQATYFSSGGFSDLWPRPKYQDEAVSAFLENLGDRYEGLFNSSNRAFPDVAAQGMDFAIYDKGSMGQVDGTSAAAPVFSAIIALLNDASLRAGGKSLGFLNPWLYKKGKDGFKDITHGGSTGCDGRMRFGGKPNGSPVIPYASWNATGGWDPVTGLGTPDFGKLVKLLP